MATDHGIDLTDAIQIVLDVEREERPELADLHDREVIDQIRDELGIGNTDEIDSWDQPDIVTDEQAAAYRAVLTATDDEIDAAV